MAGEARAPVVASDPRRALASLAAAARAVESIRRDKLGTLDTGSALLAHAGAYRLARAGRPSRVDSGLVEQQRCVARDLGRPA